MRLLYAWILSRYSASRSHGTNECPRCEPSLHQLWRTSAIKCTKSHSWLGNDTNPLCIPNPPNHTRTDKSNRCAQSDCLILVCGTEFLHLSPLLLSSEPWGQPWQPQLGSVNLSNSWFSEPYWLGTLYWPCRAMKKSSQKWPALRWSQWSCSCLCSTIRKLRALWHFAGLNRLCLLIAHHQMHQSARLEFQQRCVAMPLASHKRQS